MKILCIALLALSGLTVNAVPTCSDFEIEKACERFEPEEPSLLALPKTEKDLDVKCKASLPLLGCLIKESENCPDTLNWRKLDGYRRRKEYLDHICTKGSEYRTKYLENVNCLDEIFQDSSETCRSIIDSEDHYCSISFYSAGCLYSQIYEKCGKDATDVIRLIVNQRISMMKKECFKDDNEELISFRSFPVPFSF